MLVGLFLFVVILVHPIAMGAESHRPARLDPDPGPVVRATAFDASFACFDVVATESSKLPPPLPVTAFVFPWSYPLPLIRLTTIPPPLQPPRVRRALLQVYRI